MKGYVGGGLVEAEVSRYSERRESEKEVWEYGGVWGQDWELYRPRMVGESYEANSWRSGPLSIVSKVEYVNTGAKAG